MGHHFEELGLPLVHRGKVRDTYRFPSENKLLVVASDRLSTHNIVHQSPVPKKGEVLTALTVFYAMNILRDGVPNHIRAWGDEIYEHLPPGRYPEDFYLRALVVERLDMIPVEFVYRAYLAGSLEKVYRERNGDEPYGLSLPPGLPLMHRFGTTVFTPTEKSATDDPLHAEDVERQYPEAVFAGQEVFRKIRTHLLSVGLEMVDSKFEFGMSGGVLTLADEFGTPDSSRFVEAADIREGKNPRWLDKQIFRDEAERLWGDGPRGPLTFADGVIAEGVDVYLDIFRRITGMDLPIFQSYHMA